MANVFCGASTAHDAAPHRGSVVLDPLKVAMPNYGVAAVLC